MRAVILLATIFAAGLAYASEPLHEPEVFLMPDGDLTIDGGPVLNFSEFKRQMEPLLRRKPCVPFRLRTGSDTQFEIGRVILLLQQNGCPKIGFLTEPAPIETETPTPPN